jgi:hypothetical protein
VASDRRANHCPHQFRPRAAASSDHAPLATNHSPLRDYVALNFITAVLVLLGNLLADILYSIVDPRVRLE